MNRSRSTPSLPFVAALASISLLWVSTLALAANATDELLQASGLDRQLNIPDDPTAAVFVQDFERTSGLKLGAEFAALVEASFARSDAYGTVRTQLDGQLSSAQINELMTWYNSELGRKVTELEVLASTPEQVERMSAQINSLLGDHDRLERARHFDVLLRVTELGLHSMEVSQLAVVEGMFSAQDVPPEAQKAMKRQIKDGLAQARPQIEQFSQAMIAYTYQSLTKAEYEAYLKFLEQPASRRYHDLVTDALALDTQETYSNLGAEIGRFMKRYVSQQTAKR